MTEQQEIVEQVSIEGRLNRKLSIPLFRIAAVMTGVTLLAALWRVVLQFVLQTYRRAEVSVDANTVKLEAAFYLFGKKIRTERQVLSYDTMKAVQVENKQRYAHTLVGFGFLSVGLFTGAHWFLDGLRAGYPYLMLLAAGIILLGIIADFVLYAFVVSNNNTVNVTISSGLWHYRLTRVMPVSADRFIQRFETTKADVPHTAQ